MKKITALLCLLLALCMVACSSSIAPAESTATEETKDQVKTEEQKTTEEVLSEGPHDPTGFATGFGKVVVNPNPGVGLGGYSNADSRVSRKIVDDICITCVCISDGEEKLLFFTTDSIGASETNWKMISSKTEKEFGVPAENVLVNASHSHSAPAIYQSIPNVSAYMKTFYEGAMKAARIAVADLDKTEAKMARTQTKDLGYVRRYVNADGTYAGGTSMPDGLDPALYYHESDPDEEMLILYFDRANQEDIALCNWQCHVTSVGSESGTEVSSDYVGAFRDHVEETLGIHCTFFQGGAGSIVPNGKLAGEKQNSSDYVQHGKDVAKAFMDGFANLTPVQTGKIKTQVNVLKATVKPEQVQARGETEDLNLCVYSFGEVAFATAPYEMDHRHGMYVKENSPYALTFMSAYTNGYKGYIPAESSFSNGGYEVNSCRYVAGTGEAIQNELVSLLNTVYKSES